MSEMQTNLKFGELPEDIKVTQQTIEDRPLSYSSLKEFKKSPIHYVEYLKKKRYQTDAMRLGSLVDCLTLEPEKYEKRFLIIPQINRRTNVGKAEYKKFLDLAIENRQTIITAEQLEIAQICVRNLNRHPEAGEFLQNKVRVQKKLKWREKSTNIPMIGYVDLESCISTGEYIVDLKTDQSAQFDDFKRSIQNFDYHLQAGTYSLGYHKTQYKFPEFVWIVVETTAPYQVNVIHFPRTEVDRAKNEVLGLLKAFRRCLDMDRFNEGYRYWLMDSRKYYSYQVPKWKQSNILSYE